MVYLDGHVTGWRDGLGYEESHGARDPLVYKVSNVIKQTVSQQLAFQQVERKPTQPINHQETSHCVIKIKSLALIKVEIKKNIGINVSRNQNLSRLLTLSATLK